MEQETARLVARIYAIALLLFGLGLGGIFAATVVFEKALGSLSSGFFLSIAVLIAFLGILSYASRLVWKFSSKRSLLLLLIAALLLNTYVLAGLDGSYIIDGGIPLFLWIFVGAFYFSALYLFGFNKDVKSLFTPQETKVKR